MRMIICAVALAAALPGAAHAQDQAPREWFVEMKGAAKRVRIAATIAGGRDARPDLQTQQAIIRSLDMQVRHWPASWTASPAFDDCQLAVSLLGAAAAAAETGNQAKWQDNWTSYSGYERRCIDAINRGV